MTEPSMLYAELEPLPELRPWIASIWTFAVAPHLPDTLHHIPLTGGMMLCICRGGELLLAGERMAPLVTTVTGNAVYWGVHFWPGAAGAFLGVKPRDLREWVGPASLQLNEAWCKRWSNVFQGNGEQEIVGRIDGLLTELAASARSLDPIVMTAVFRIVRSGGAESVEQIARAVELSARQLRRRFAAQTALAPKELARIRRVRAAAVDAVADSMRWIDLASRGGYADQSHLVREFREILGLSPIGFRAHAERITHRLRG